MEYNFKSEGNLETVNDNTSMKVPNFVLKENNHHTPLNYFESNSNPKNIPSPIYEYFDTSQKFLKNSSERNFAKSIHSLLSTKGAEISPQSKEISLNQLTPNFDDNFFGIKGQSPSPNGNGLINKEINEYLKSKQHLLTQNYKDNISENNTRLQKEGIVNKNNMNRNVISMTPEVGEEEEEFENNVENEFEQKEMFDFNMNQNKIGNVLFHNDNFPSNMQINNQQSLNNLNIPHINNNNYYKQIQQQPQSNYLMNNSVNQFNNNSNELNYNFQHIQSSLPNKQNQPQNNPFLDAQMEQQILYSKNKSSNNQFIPQNMTNNFQKQNFFQQKLDTIGTKNNQQMQQLQVNNNNMNFNQNIGINTNYTQNVQNYSISQLNPECYIFERFGKRGWQCEKCNNFNFECKFIV